MTERKKRKYPYVQILPPQPAGVTESGKPRRARLSVRLKWADPQRRGKWLYETIDGVTDVTHAKVNSAARKRSAELQTTKRVSGNNADGERSIGDEIARYLGVTCTIAKKGKNKGHAMSASTVKKYAVSLGLFVAWCKTQEIVTLGDLTRPLLAEYKLWLLTCGTSSVRKASTANADLKPLKAMLAVACADGRLTTLSSEAIKAALAFYVEPDADPVCMSTDELRAHLREQNTRDADLRIPMAPIMAAGLLAIARRRELTSARVGAFEPRRKSQYDPSLLNPILRVDGKTGPRVIELLPYSPLLLELLTALAAGRDERESLFGVGYEELGKACELRGFMFKSLRSTGVTYQRPLPMSDDAKNARAGHSAEVAAEHYINLPEGLPPTAASLDEVMKLEPELRAIIAAVYQRRAPLHVPRSRRALLASARVVATSLQPRP